MGLFAFSFKALEPQQNSPPPMRSSWEVFRERFLPSQRHLRWIVIAHRPTHTLIDSLLRYGVSILRIYAPEHGLFGEKAAGKVVQDTMYRGIPVVSLYGKRRAPTADELRQADAVLFALRDVGVRHYTYLSTLTYILKVAAEAHRPVWVLDFPNPHAHYTYGAILDSSLFSFIGMHPIPLVPGLTIGEYAQLIVGEGWVPPVALQVVPWEGWRKIMPTPEISPFFSEPPSPALRTLAAIELYPILGWYEGTCCVSVGRNTAHPFEQVGLPLKYRLPLRDTILYGYELRATQFRPQGESETYHGWRIRRVYEGKVRPDSLFRLGFFLLKTFRQAIGDAEAFYNETFFDKVFGSTLWRKHEHEPIEQLYMRFMTPAAWEETRRKYQLYD